METKATLNDWAKKFVAGDPVVLFVDKNTRTYPNGDIVVLSSEDHVSEKVDVTKRETGEHVDSNLFEPLFEYEFPDGTIYREVVQQKVQGWSGEWFALCLTDLARERVRGSIWTHDRLYPATL